MGAPFVEQGKRSAWLKELYLERERRDESYPHDIAAGDLQRKDAIEQNRRLSGITSYLRGDGAEPSLGDLAAWADELGRMIEYLTELWRGNVARHRMRKDEADRRLRLMSSLREWLYAHYKESLF